MMTTENNLLEFEEHALGAMQKISEVSKSMKQLKEIDAQNRKYIEGLMEEYDVKSIDNEFVKITYVEPTEATSVDIKLLETKEPELHQELLEDYPKVTKRKGYARITAK